jgi:hypothetical protein
MDERRSFCVRRVIIIVARRCVTATLGKQQTAKRSMPNSFFFSISSLLPINRSKRSRSKHSIKSSDDVTLIEFCSLAVARRTSAAVALMSGGSLK